MGTMFDAVDVAAIPADATIVAGYVDGNWPTYQELVKTFPSAQHVSITTRGEPGAMVADCETGDLTPQSAASWAHGEIAAGRRPCIYYARSNAPAVSAALTAQGVPIADVDFWVADWTGTPHLIPGSVATQYADPTTSGGNFDISETAPGWPHGHVVPPPPPNAVQEEEIMSVVVDDPNGGKNIVTYVVLANDHVIEITRKVGTEGQPLAGNGSLIDLSDEFPNVIP